ncbi:MAG TPA: hypothetical protein VMV49_02020 [Candidatus Deferrimicrobium sp.]|nr:hypothetical protein [Candidatus Deferrimicrobium sp.]
MSSDDVGIIFAILSLTTGLVGIFYLGLFLGAAALLFGILVLGRKIEDKILTSQFKIIAVFGLFLGILEMIISILGLAGIGQ